MGHVPSNSKRQPTQEELIDRLVNRSTGPKIAMNTYYHTAGQAIVSAHLDQMPAQAQAVALSGIPLTQLHLTVVGNKIPGDKCCLCITMICAVLLIFPMLLVCCDWWKSTVQPKYEVSIETYQAIAKAVDSVPTINHLALRVADNAFNTQKANILYYVMVSRKLKSFIFENKALEFDWREGEFSNFRANMQPIVSLGVPCEIKWRDQIVGV